MNHSKEDICNKLMIESQSGNNASYQKLFKIIAPIVSNIVSKKIFNETDQNDVTQTILMAVHKASHTYQQHKPFIKWLNAICNYKINYYLIHYYKRSEFESTEEQNFQKNALGTFNTENKIEIKRMLKSLPKEQANILRLLKIEGYSIKDISKAFHLSESSVKVRMHRIIKDLKDKFGSQK